VTSTVGDELAGSRGSAIGAIRRRHVVYVEGYDPAGAKGYFKLFRRACERFRFLWPISLTLHPLEIDSENFAHWSLDLRGPDWQTATRYDFLRLESFIRSDMAQRTFTLVWRGLGWFVGDVLGGAEFRIFRASWRFALHLLYFQLLLLGWVATAVAVGVIVGHTIIEDLFWPAPAGVIASLVAAVLTLLALRPIADRCRVNQINCCWVLLRKFARSRPTWLDRAIEVGARHLLDLARANAADELAVVGHSAGGVTAAAIMARAFELDPDLGRSGPRLVLLTLGSVMPAAALHPRAQRMKDVVRRLATTPALTWVDCQSRKDIMCFGNFDPVEGIGIHVGAQRRNPVPWRISFKDMILPQAYGRFRWSFFRMHYQFIMTGDRPAPYDYILLTGGPTLIAAWPVRDRALMAALSGTGSSGDAPRRDNIAIGASP
jgi:hypothetical protein